MGTATCTSFPSRSTLRRKIPILPELCFRDSNHHILCHSFRHYTSPCHTTCSLKLVQCTSPCAVCGGDIQICKGIGINYCYRIFYIAYKLRKILSTFSGLALQTDWDQHVDVCLGHLGQPWRRATCPVLLTATARSFA